MTYPSRKPKFPHDAQHALAQLTVHLGGSSLSQAEAQCRFGLLFQSPHLYFPTLLSKLQSVLPSMALCWEAMGCQAPVCLLDRKPHPHSGTPVHKASSL